MHRLQPIIVVVETPGVQFSPSSGGTDTGGHPPHRCAGSHQSLHSKHLFQASHSHTQTVGDRLSSEAQRAPADSHGRRFRCERRGTSGSTSSLCFQHQPVLSPLSFSCSLYFTDSHTCTHSHAGVETLAHRDTPPSFLLPPPQPWRT